MSKPRAPKHVLQKLRKARRAAAMETAHFGSNVVLCAGDDPVTKDQFIKEQTQRYRDTSLIPLLDDLIKWGEGE